MMGGNPIQFDYTLLFSLVAIPLFLVIPLLIIYLLVSAVKYFKHKSALDKELLQKLDELIRLQTQNSEHK